MAELAQMQEEFDLHPLAIEDAARGHQRPKIEEYGETVFVVMQLLETHNAEVQVGEVAIFVGRNFVLSVRSGSQQHFLGVRERCEREPDIAKARLRLCFLRFDGCRRGSILPVDRRFGG
jgi:magnesium transporter